MTVSRYPRLTSAKRQHIQECRAQGLTYAAIANKVRCSAGQVAYYLSNLPSRRIPSVAITNSQYRLIIEFERCRLSIKATAARLEVDGELLRQELVGAKSMSTKRIGQIKRILAEKL
jgi:hypothetical protein